MIVMEPVLRISGLTVPLKETRRRQSRSGARGRWLGSSTTATSGTIAALLGDWFYFSRRDIGASLAATTHQLSLS